MSRRVDEQRGGVVDAHVADCDRGSARSAARPAAAGRRRRVVSMPVAWRAGAIGEHARRRNAAPASACVLRPRDDRQHRPGGAPRRHRHAARSQACPSWRARRQAGRLPRARGRRGWPDAAGITASVSASPSADAVGELAEVDPAGGADALDVAAERHDVEIGLEQIALRVARLEPERGGDLPQLAGRCLAY